MLSAFQDPNSKLLGVPQVRRPNLRPRRQLRTLLSLQRAAKIALCKKVRRERLHRPSGTEPTKCLQP